MCLRRQETRDKNRREYTRWEGTIDENKTKEKKTAKEKKHSRSLSNKTSSIFYSNESTYFIGASQT